jgi:hypothetical protein
MKNSVRLPQDIPAMAATGISVGASTPTQRKRMKRYASEWRESNKHIEELSWRIPPSGG